MTAQRYGQGCAIAGALDLLGQRWTLLIVRDLLIGPRRYTDLLAGLPGIGTNLLAARLKELVAAGLVERTTLPPPGVSRVYRLTPRGQALEASLVELCRWGLEGGLGAAGREVYDARWAILAMRAAFSPTAARGLSLACEFRIGELVFFAAVDDGELATGLGPATAPDLVLAVDEAGFEELVFGERGLEELAAAGRAALRGAPADYARFAALFAVDPASAEGSTAPSRPASRGRSRSGAAASRR